MHKTAKVLDTIEIQHLLNTEQLGKGERLVYISVVDSTNKVAMSLARDGSAEGTVVLANTQTAGKGRQGRAWRDVAGCNILSSTILRPIFPPHLLVMAGSLAVVTAIRETCGIQASIKWPNDILIEGQKVAGILIESSHDKRGGFIAILGIGINVQGESAQVAESPEQRAQANPGKVFTTPTTLEEESGHAVSREELCANLLNALEASYIALQREASDPDLHSQAAISRLIREQWRSHLSTLNRTVQVQQGHKLLSGVAEDVNENGELLLRMHSGEQIIITWGDVG